MKSLIILYFGVIFLAMCSQRYYPVRDREHILGYHFMRRRMDFFMILIVWWMAAFSFLRTSYNDTGNYIGMFRNSESVAEFWERNGLSDWTGNPLHELYRDWVRQITENYHIYFMFPALLNTIAVVKLCKRYSPNFGFSLLIFFSIGTYVMYIAAIKQSIAVSILLFSLPYARDRKYIRFYLLVFLAMLFHTHAFLFAIVLFLFEKPWGKITYIFAGTVVFAMLTYDKTLGAFMSYAQSLGANVAETEVFDGHQINAIRILVYAAVPAIAFLFRGRLFRNSTRMENLFVNMSIASFLILCIGLVEGANLYARMAGYFEIGTAIALPWMIYKLFEKTSARLFSYLAEALYFGYFTYEFAISKSFSAEYSAITFWQFLFG